MILSPASAGSTPDPSSHFVVLAHDKRSTRLPKAASCRLIGLFECFSEAREAAQQEFFDLLSRPPIEAAAASPWTEQCAQDNDSHPHGSDAVELHANVLQNNVPSANQDDGTIPAEYPPSPTEAPSGIHQGRGSSSGDTDQPGNAPVLQSSKRNVVWRAFAEGESSSPSVWIEKLPCRMTSTSSSSRSNSPTEKTAETCDGNGKGAALPVSCSLCSIYSDESMEGVPWWQLSSVVQAVLRCMLDPDAHTDEANDEGRRSRRKNRNECKQNHKSITQNMMHCHLVDWLSYG